MIFGSLDAIMSDLYLLCKKVVIFHCGIAGCVRLCNYIQSINLDSIPKGTA